MTFKPKFSFDINLGHLIIMFSNLVAVIAFIMTMKSDINLTRKDVEIVKEVEKRHDLAIAKLEESQQRSSQNIAIISQQLIDFITFSESGKRLTSPKMSNP